MRQPQEVFMRTHTTSTRRRLAIGLAALAASGAGASVASADSDPGLYAVSNDQGADVHQAGSSGEPWGLYLGHLVKTDKFDTDRANSDGRWCHGHAYGSVHQDGWLLCQDLTPTSW